VPDAAIRTELVSAAEESLIAEARQRLARRRPFASAHLDLPLRVRVGFVALYAGIVVLTALAPLGFEPYLLPPLAMLLLLPALLRLVAAVLPVPRIEAPALEDADLPVYSVLIPLRDEDNMVPQLHRAMAALDYPAEKLDIKFIVESQSATTLAAVRTLLADPRFELVTVPDALPSTKPKALNFALPFVRGRFVVVYDAEDIPDPGQLRDAAARFAAEPGIDCLQAVLDIDNVSESWLSSLFAAEYAGLFILLLPLMARLHLPMPLGGSSNHFRTTALREVGGWDAFNVTEDADLGLRLARLRYRTGTLPNRTGEEAPITLGALMAQRTRSMKGWMQTLIVHNRSPRRLLADIGWRKFLAFELYVGGLILSAPLHTVLLGAIALRLMSERGWSPTGGWDWAFAAVLVIGYGGAFALVVAGLVRSGRARLVPVQLLLPVYWVMHSIAAFKAAQELLVRPYFWAKTPHGRTRMKRGRDAQERPGALHLPMESEREL
jgi:hypothetical protein